jgi:hypothetical protein
MQTQKYLARPKILEQSYRVNGLKTYSFKNIIPHGSKSGDKNDQQLTNACLLHVLAPLQI